MKDSLKERVRAFMPRTVRPHRILGGRLRGYRIVTSWHDYPGAILGHTERPLLEWFERHVSAGETWLDVGAHYGYTAIALSRLVGSEGRVFAFEPDVATAGCLERTRDVNRLPQLTVVPVGLGNPGSLELHHLPVIRGMVDRTLGPGQDSLTAFLAARLDWLWDHICGEQRHIHGIKIDIQGMEFEALQGMRTLLAEFIPRLVIEVHEGVDRSALLDLIESVGYGRRGDPVEPSGNEDTPLYLDDRSYSFRARSRVTLDV